MKTTPEEYIIREYGNNWLNERWRPDDVIVALREYAEQAIAEREAAKCNTDSFWFDKWNEKDPDEVKRIMDGEEYQKFIHKLPAAYQERR